MRRRPRGRARLHHRSADAVTAFADTLRGALSSGSDRELLDDLVGRLAEQLDVPAVAVAKHDAGALELVAAHGWPDGVGLPENRLSVGQGITGEAFRTGQPVVCTDTTTDARYLDASAGEHRSALAIPMRLADRNWGVLVAESEEVGAFDQRDVDTLQPVADLMGWAFESARLRRETDERAERETRLRRGLEASARVITVGLEAPDSSAALDRMTREVRDALGYDVVTLITRHGDVLECVSEDGAPSLRGARMAAHRGILGHALGTGRAYLAVDVDDDPHYVPRLPGVVSEMCAPLSIAGRTVGILNVESTSRSLDDVDLTVLRRLAEQLSLVLHNSDLLAAEKETVARLHELDRLKSKILTIASHELRTPLTVVIGFAQVLAEHGDRLSPEKSLEYATAIARQAGSLSRLVDHMLIAAELERGQLAIAPTATDLLPVVAEALTGRDPHIDVLPGIGDVRVLADPFRLRQVLENLFDNAVKYASAAGRIQVDARRVGDDVVILLRDEGPGIPRGEQEAVFEAFHQVGQHGVAGRRGVGLGLAVARDLVRLMGGELDLASAEGYGATFTLRLPAGD